MHSSLQPLEEITQESREIGRQAGLRSRLGGQHNHGAGIHQPRGFLAIKGHQELVITARDPHGVTPVLVVTLDP